jgi:hypothetical protein
VTLRAVLIGFAIVVLLLVVVAGPSAVAEVTGRPLVAECVGPDPAVCDEAVSQATSGGGRGLFGPVTWIKIRLDRGNCGTYTVGRWWPVVDPFAVSVQPFC